MAFCPVWPPVCLPSFGNRLLLWPSPAQAPPPSQEVLLTSGMEGAPHHPEWPQTGWALGLDHAQDEGLVPDGVECLGYDLGAVGLLLRDGVSHHGLLPTPGPGAAPWHGCPLLDDGQQAVGVTEPWGGGGRMRQPGRWPSPSSLAGGQGVGVGEPPIRPQTLRARGWRRRNEPQGTFGRWALPSRALGQAVMGRGRSQEEGPQGAPIANSPLTSLPRMPLACFTVAFRQNTGF